jgi:hypothetical protein
MLSAVVGDFGVATLDGALGATVGAGGPNTPPAVGAVGEPGPALPAEVAVVAWANAVARARTSAVVIASLRKFSLRSRWGWRAAFARVIPAKRSRT